VRNAVRRVVATEVRGSRLGRKVAVAKDLSPFRQIEWNARMDIDEENIDEEDIDEEDINAEDIDEEDTA
jgi:hypothetical protein